MDLTDFCHHSISNVRSRYSGSPVILYRMVAKVYSELFRLANLSRAFTYSAMKAVRNCCDGTTSRTISMSYKSGFVKGDKDGDQGKGRNRSTVDAMTMRIEFA